MSKQGSTRSSSKAVKRAKARAKARSRTSSHKFEHRDIRLEELKAILARAKQGALSDDDVAQMEAAVDTLAILTVELEAKGTTILRLRKMLFGPTSENSRTVLGVLDSQGEHEQDGAATPEGEAAGDGSTESENEAQRIDGPKADEEGAGAKPKPKPKRKGHGRNGADAYVGAERVEIEHESLSHKDQCPCCQDGKVYVQRAGRKLVRVTGVAPLLATVYEQQTLRCNLCGDSFVAKAPPEVGEQKYDETAAAMMGLLRYGCGLPMNRLERLGDQLGMPMPASTQWDVLKRASLFLEPVWVELVWQAAQGDILHVDDTKAKVLELNDALRKALEAGEGERTGVFTSGVLSRREGRDIALFLTGSEHAGENLAKVLAERSSQLSPPIQMCDALSRNTCGEFEAIVANCLTHGRRNFVDVVESFPDEVSHVLDVVGQVYKYDAETREGQMSEPERLAYHVEKSKPLMDGLSRWFEERFEQRLVEPNSSLGKAIKYMQNHWEKLTLFLRVGGAPLDNNIVERALKRAIMHRKNSLFYKTESGAHVGDMFMSLIHTCELGGENPFEYLVALQRHHKWVEQAPGQWMSWNWREAVSLLDATPPAD